MYKYLKLIVILFFYFLSFSSEKVIAVEKIKIGLLVPMTGDDKEIGIQIIKSIRIALKDINSINLLQKIQIQIQQKQSMLQMN